MPMTLRSGLYAITDPELLPGQKLYDGVEAALRGGAVLVQYRDKLAPEHLRRERATALLRICERYGCPLIINDDPALALGISAAGAHLGQDDPGIAEARQLLGPDKLLGATCHSSMTLARGAAKAGCDYLAFGRFFSSQTKQHAPAAPFEVLTQARPLGLPLVAIGGLTLGNVAPVVAAGADLIAVVHGLFAAADIEYRARQFTQLIHDVHARRA